MNASGERQTSRDTANPVRIRLLDEPSFTHVGKMDFVDNRVDPATGTIRGRALVPNPGGFLTPGQFGRLQLLGSGEFDALLVPDSAILSDQSRRFVWAMGKDDVPESARGGAGQSRARLAHRARRPAARRSNRDQRHAARAARRQGHSDQRAHRASRPAVEGTAAMGFSKLFIDRPILAGVISVMIMLVGAVAYFALPVSQYPEVAPPSITVTTSYPGANAETAAATVAAPLEQEINGVERMLYLSSQSTADGRTTITVTFALGTDLDAAQVLVQNRVNIALPRLPEEVRRLGVVTNKNTPDILMVVHIYSPDSSRDQLYLSNYTLLNIRDRLARLDGVGDLRLFGAREYSMRIWLDPNRISALGLTAGEVVQALRGQNVQVAGGVLDRPPSTRQGAYEVGVQLLGRLTDPAQFGDVLIKSAEEGRLVRVRDVGRIELGAVDYSTNAYLDDKPAVAVPVFQRPGSNALETARGVEALMASLRSEFPKGLDYDIIYNPSEFIAESVREVQKTIFEAAILVVVVVVLFLQSWRASVIPLVAIPVSLVGTFAVLQAFGFSLNTLSLFGLVLAIGIVVDDAIVVVEDVERNLHEGMTPREAAHRTMDEVGGALVAIALVLSAVFVPTAFIPGISGQFYRQFALTISSATLISCLVSLTLSPALAALLLRPRGGGRRSLVGRIVGRFFDGFNAGFDRLSNLYGTGVGKIVRVSALVLVVYAGLIVLTGVQFWRAPGGFIPAQDQGYFITIVQLPPGSSLSRTDAVVQRAIKDLLAIPGVAHTASFTGFDAATSTNASNAAAVFFTVIPFAERAAHGVDAATVLRTARQRMAAIAEANIVVIRAAVGPRPQHDGRLQVHRPGPGGAGTAGAARCRRPGHRRSRARARPHRGVLTVRGLDATALRRHRSRPRPGTRRAAVACVRGARGLPRIVVRERFQLPRPHLPGDRAGRLAVQTHGAEYLRAPHPQRHRRHGAARIGGHVS